MLAFDHLVVFSRKIEEAQRNFAHSNDIVTVKGGHHESWGTYNYLAFMENNCYIEWLGIENIEVAQRSNNPLIRQTVQTFNYNKEGPFQFALRTNNLDPYLHFYRLNNISFDGPYPGSRKQPDGSVLNWRMLFPSVTSSAEILPFLIEWEGDGNQPKENSLINPIPFSSICIGVKNFHEDIALFQKVYQLNEPKISTYKTKKIAEWDLANGKLQLSSDGEMNVHFGQIIFTR
jgi:hypothetical protein